MKGAPELVFLPIVTRQLRAAAKRPRMYYGRMSVALAWIMAGSFALLTVSSASIGKVAGAQLFYCASVVLLGWSILSTWAGCDSISEEKREGTIGLLFLTDLKSHDIVLGKMAAAAVPAFYGALAGMPMLAIFTLMGGVNASQYVKTGLAILNVFFLGQTVAVFASAVCRERGNNMGFPLLVIAAYLVAFAVTSVAAELKGWQWPGILFQHVNPLRPFQLALQSSFAPGIIYVKSGSSVQRRAFGTASPQRLAGNHSLLHSVFGGGDNRRNMDHGSPLLSLASIDRGSFASFNVPGRIDHGAIFPEI